ncbi:unnamed protein product [Urochloa decumbens]|uniref:Uncharacterized protein n=1 Tax=Urochloa decumbens TaxID=240449 RepID=A0ABC9D9M9_9POAL
MSSRTRLSSVLTATASSTAPSPLPPRSALLDALAAATDRARAGTLRPADAHQLFDELLRQRTRVPGRLLNGFLAALAKSMPSSACSDGPALAIALFNRMSQHSAGPRVLPASVHTYGILIDCCCHVRRPDLALAFFGRLLRTGLGINVITFNSLLKGLCDAKRTEEALDVLLCQMPQLGCVSDVISYSVLLKSFCNEKRSQRAVELLRMMAKQGGVCSPDVVAYNTVMDGLFKEGEVAKACDLFHEMAQQGIEPDVVTYSSVIDALCKARAMDKAEMFFRQMVDKGVQPDSVTYNSLIHGYSTLGLWKEATRLFKEMARRGVKPDVVTYSTVISAFCRMGQLDDAVGIFTQMIDQGVPPNEAVYCCLIQGFCNHGGLEKVKELVSEMISKGLLEEADDIFSAMENTGCAPDSRLLNDVARVLLEKGEIIRAGNYLAKMDEKNFSLEASTTEMLISLFSMEGTCLEHIKLLPEKYQFLMGANNI